MQSHITNNTSLKVLHLIRNSLYLLVVRILNAQKEYWQSVSEEWHLSGILKVQETVAAQAKPGEVRYTKI